MKIALLTVALLSGAIAHAADQQPATKPVPKPQIVTAKEWGSTPQPMPEEKRHTPKFITIHHAGVVWKPGGDPQKMVKNMQAWGQKEKGWADVPYHFLIAPNGRIFEGRPLAYEPDSNTKFDLKGHINVELMGNFEEQRVDVPQLTSLAKIVAWLTQELNIDTSQ